MGWSFKIGRILGIDFKVHFTFFLILIWGALNFGGSAGPLYGLAVTMALFTLVLLHEQGHSLAAMRYGIGVRDITLLPIGGVAALHRAVSPYGVGVDIACRMCLTIFEGLTPTELRANRDQFLADLVAETRFGYDDFADRPRQHPVLGLPDLTHSAASQLGTDAIAVPQNLTW